VKIESICTVLFHRKYEILNIVHTRKISVASRKPFFNSIHRLENSGSRYQIYQQKCPVLWTKWFENSIN